MWLLGVRIKSSTWVHGEICSCTELFVDSGPSFGQRTHQNTQRRGFVFEGHLLSPAESMTKGCGGRCSALLPASREVTYTQCFSTHAVKQDKCSECSLTSVWKPHLFLQVILVIFLLILSSCQHQYFEEAFLLLLCYVSVVVFTCTCQSSCWGLQYCVKV